MPLYRIHLAKVGTFTISESDIKKDLQTWFRSVIKHNPKLRRKYSGVEIVWWKDMKKDIKVGDREVLIYLVKSERKSIIKQKWGSRTSDLNGLTYTSPRGLTTSEAYCGCRSGRFIAETIFHEALHNKTGWSDKKQHRRGGLGGSATSITKPVIKNQQKYELWVPKGQPTEKMYNKLLCKNILIEKHKSIKGILTKRNISDMAKHLDIRRKQWADGFKFLRDRNKKIKIDLSGDPLKGL